MLAAFIGIPHECQERDQRHMLEGNLTTVYLTCAHRFILAEGHSMRVSAGSEKNV